MSASSPWILAIVCAPWLGCVHAEAARDAEDSEDTGTIRAVARTESARLPAVWEAAGYGGTCEVLAPTGEDALPLPPTWQPCVGAFVRDIPGCEGIVFGDEGPANVIAAAGIRGTRELMLAITRGTVDGYETTVHAVTGSVLAAFRSEVCPLLPLAATGDTYAFDVYDTYREQLDGVIAGRFGSIRAELTYASRFDVVPARASAGTLGLLDSATRTLFPWDAHAPSVVLPLAPSRSRASEMRVVLGRVVAGADSFGGASWRPFLRASSAEAVRVGVPATDGVDVVWVEASTNEASASLRTAKVGGTTELLRSRHVAALDVAFLSVEWVVGCGRAAGGDVVIDSANGAVLRLPDVGVAQAYGAPLGIDCEHLYLPLVRSALAAGNDASTRVIRMPLSSLR